MTHKKGNTRGVVAMAAGTTIARGALAVVAAGALAGCLSTAPKMGGGSGNTVTGAAGGATSENANSKLERCDETLGTLAVQEDQSAVWWRDYYRRYPRLGSTVPVLRTMIQQSNCFVVVERGRAMNNMMQERQLERSGEMRGGSNFGQGQMVAADYTMSPSIQFSAKGTEGIRVGGIGPIIGGLAAAAGSMKANEAATTLLLIDNRSGVQVSAAEGSAKNFDFGFFGGGFLSGLGAAGGSGFSNTPEGKVIVAAFADSYNQMVRALRSYKAQTVRGGLGTGGRLGVQGGSTPASKELDKPK
jgi:curli biogenesis system outer membrane secretion channel CsgG